QGPMKHPLNFLLRIGRSESDCMSLLGDLEEEYRARLARGGHRWPAFAWYTAEVVSALLCGLRDRATRLTPHPPSHEASAWRALAPGAILTDLRYALRRWRHRPGFAVT